MENSNSKVAFITGANKGIGLETARGLGKLGITVILGSRDSANGEKAVADLKRGGVTSARALKFDVNTPGDHRKALDEIQQRYGKLDILVNNAGITEDVDFSNPSGVNTAPTISPETLRGIFDTNFFNLVALTQTLLPMIRKSPAGRIVNLSSILGSLKLHADPKSPIYNVKAFGYDASKAAINAFTVHLAQALKDTKIKVNSAHPGWVKTDMGGPNAPMELADGGKTSVQLATLPDDGPTGGFFHMGDRLPW